MKRISIGIAVAFAGLTASVALAANAHWVSGPSVSASGNTLTISGKAAGLGNTVSSTDFSLSGSINVSSRCYTKSNNTPQAANKQETINVSETDSFPVRNGSVTVTFTVSPLSTLTCPHGQVVRIESFTYDLNLTNSSFPSLDTHLTS